jgi:hypothetical protein
MRVHGAIIVIVLTEAELPTPEDRREITILV